MSLLILTVIILLVNLAFIDLWRKQSFLLKLGNVKCISHLPIIGSAHLFIFKGVEKFFTEWTTIAESSSLLWVFSHPIYSTRDPDELEIILSSKDGLSKGNIYDFMEPFKYSLVACDVDTWKIHRRLLNKCFKQRQINHFVQLFNEFAALFETQISSEMTIGELREISERNFFNIFFASLGDSGTKEMTSFLGFDMYTALKTAENIVMDRFFNPWLYPQFIFSRTTGGKIFRTIMNQIDESASNVVEYLRNRQKTTEEIIKKENAESNFVDILLKEYEPHELKNELKLFGAASEGTTGSTLVGSLFLLGMHQDIQEKVYQEVKAVVGLDRTVETNDLPLLKYTTMVIYETLRLFSPIMFIMRKASGNIDLGGGRCIPKDTDILINISELHRDSKLWTDPLKFDPERFLSKEVQKRHPCAFLPFSYGPRNCVGLKFAETELKIFIVNIVRRYQISSSCQSIEEVELPKTIFIQLPGHMKLKFEKRLTK